MFKIEHIYIYRTQDEFVCKFVYDNGSINIIRKFEKERTIKKKKDLEGFLNKGYIQEFVNEYADIMTVTGGGLSITIIYIMIVDTLVYIERFCVS